MVEEMIKREVASLKVTPSVAKEAPPPKPASATTGIVLTEEDKLKAADLRMAFLIGKIPDSPGLLIDGKTTSRLLGISHRTRYRLVDILKALRSGRWHQVKLIRAAFWAVSREFSPSPTIGRRFSRK